MPRPRLSQVVVSLLGALPALDMVQALYRHNPHFIRAYDFKAFMFAIDRSGEWAFVFLFLALACTPVQRLVRSAWLPGLRRPLGLAAFGYCVLHFLAYFVIGQKLNVRYVFEDARLEPLLLPGWGSLLLLVPLAMTSTDGMIRRLGGRRWKLLHRLVYPSAALAILHVYMVGTTHNNYAPTWKVVVPFLILMMARLIRFRRTPALA